MDPYETMALRVEQAAGIANGAEPVGAGPVDQQAPIPDVIGAMGQVLITKAPPPPTEQQQPQQQTQQTAGRGDRSHHPKLKAAAPEFGVPTPEPVMAKASRREILLIFILSAVRPIPQDDSRNNCDHAAESDRFSL